MIQKVIVAAMTMAAKKVSAQRSYRTPLATQVSLFDVDGDGALSRAELWIERPAADDSVRS